MALLLLFLLFLAFPFSAAASSLEISPAAEGIIVANDRWPSTASLQQFGEDCIRLAGARTDEEKAIAIWRCTIMFTGVTEIAPSEPALGRNYIAHPMKILNVYGGHYCDGLSRIMEMTWRALGYRADKLYKFGHTLADIYYRDADGVARWHVFDLSQRWFVYDRSGSHISTAEEQALDHSLLYYPSRTTVPDQPSLMQPSYIHTGHLQFESYTTGISLRTSEMIEFTWGNDGISYFNLFGKKPLMDGLHGPYPVTQGGGRLVTKPLATPGALHEYVAGSSLNVTTSSGGKNNVEIHPQEAGKAASLIIPVSLPYIISEVEFGADILRKTAEDTIVISISTDQGKTWRKYWEAPEGPEFQEIRGKRLSESFNPRGTRRLPQHTPFGKYGYLIKIEMKAAAAPQDCRIEDLVIITKFQHNIFSLPMLWPGRNEIAIKGSIRGDRELSVIYEWDDARSAGKTKTIRITQTPAFHVIEAQGRKWEDVRCRTLRIAALPRSANGETASANAGNPEKAAITLHKAVSVGKIMGTTIAPKSDEAATLIRKLEDAMRRQAQPDIAPNDLKAIGSQVGSAILALGALRNPSAREVLEQIIMDSRTHAFQHRVWAIQALYNTVGKEAIPVLMKVLGKDAAVVFYDPDKQWTKDAMWLHAAATAATALASMGNSEESAKAADLISAALENHMTAIPLRQIWRGEEIEWALIRALGRLGGQRHAPVLYDYLRPGDDTDAMAEALTALAQMGAHDALPRIVLSLRSFQYLPVGLHAVAAIGKLGTPKEAAYLTPLLLHGDEEMRAEAAKALAMIGGIDVVTALRSAADNEQIQWVRDVIETAAREVARGK